ncbi:hypothetical protein [Bacillus sp. CGMCC 1.16541]|uniref:hypothetical protein n=1 Tax=Bacillus sp. CGMCC 1.16541 TaxID=2185143 RepID=UPI000D736721|nr:hypothetical protein [Bacillus sp. CGMCC 1.16541]
MYFFISLVVAVIVYFTDYPLASIGSIFIMMYGLVWSLIGLVQKKAAANLSIHIGRLIVSTNIPILNYIFFLLTGVGTWEATEYGPLPVKFYWFFGFQIVYVIIPEIVEHFLRDRDKKLRIGWNILYPCLFVFAFFVYIAL